MPYIPPIIGSPLAGILTGTNAQASSGNPVLNAQWTAKGTSLVTERYTGVRASLVDAAGVNELTISAATNASPIEVTTATHGYATGDKVAIWACAGNTAANGAWTITVTGATTFTLNGSTGNGAYSGSGKVTNRPMLYGFYATVAPSVARGGLTGTVANADDIDAFVAYNGGTVKATDCFYIGRNTGIAGSEWTTGFSIDANCDIGIAVNGTMATAAIRIPNDTPVQGRQTGGVFVNLWRINTLNELQFDAPSRLNSAMTIGNAVNLAFSTSTGTKIGTGNTQKIGFWNATPVAQPAANANTSGATLAALETEVNELKQLLRDVGFMAP